MVEETFMDHDSLHVSQDSQTSMKMQMYRVKYLKRKKKNTRKKEKETERGGKKQPLMWKEAKREYLEIPLVASYCLPSEWTWGRRRCVLDTLTHTTETNHTFLYNSKVLWSLPWMVTVATKCSQWHTVLVEMVMRLPRTNYTHFIANCINC